VNGGKERFAQLLRAPDGELDLGLAALLIAQEEYPELDVEACLRQLDALGRQARERIRPGMTPPDVVGALGRLLAEEEGFRGHEDDYYDPRNSFLNDVLERRVGIPITLSVLYVEVARRAGVPAEGVGFPAHFLARFEEVVFDPFHGGRVLTHDDCAAMLEAMSGGSIPFTADLLQPTPGRQIAVRMLNNLKHIYLNARYYRKAIGIMDRLLLVSPDAADELRDRGAVYTELKQYAAAREDFQAYLRKVPGAADRNAVRQALARIDSVVTLMDD
jgi:regulator of sirC expression with transglutaminase-like and TPR domain